MPEKKYKFICGQHNIRTNNLMIWQSHMTAKHPDIEVIPEGQTVPSEISKVGDVVKEKMEILPPPQPGQVDPEEVVKEQLKRADEEVSKLPTIAKMNEKIAGLEQAITQTNLQLGERLEAIFNRINEVAKVQAPATPMDVGKTPEVNAQKRLEATVDKASKEQPSGNASMKGQTMKELRQKMALGKSGTPASKTPQTTTPAGGQAPAEPPSDSGAPAVPPIPATILAYAGAFADILNKLPFWRGGGEQGSPVDEKFIGQYNNFMKILTSMQDIASKAEANAEKRVMDRLKFMFKLAPETVSKALTEGETKPKETPKSEEGEHLPPGE